jgi:hypothetical protein
MNNERLTLMWHPSQTSTNKKFTTRRSPQCVKVWIESGVYLNDGTFLLPKLTWSKVSEITSNSTNKTKSNKAVKNALQYGTMLEKLDLLDICRIYPLTYVNRAIYPFVLLRKSFCIETQYDKYIFQTQTIDERDRIVYGLKLVVARLASLLMLRDIRAAEEFFGTIVTTTGNTTTTATATDNTIHNTVPGNAPDWSFISQQQPPQQSQTKSD